MSLLLDQIKALEGRLQKACALARRARSDVELLPVSKGQPVARIAEALDSGLCPTKLGENYLDELALKSEHFKGSKIEWHYLGRLQSRKIKDIAKIASVVHGVSRVQELEALKPFDVRFYVQVNISGEGQKNGVEPAELPLMLKSVESLGLSHRLLGLMGMSLAPLDDASSHQQLARKNFSQLRSLRDQFAPAARLNMGMSDDFEDAIAEGSSLVRLGSAFFGPRQ
jgi:pyridoxal phosphate enzyme (YggS family)